MQGREILSPTRRVWPSRSEPLSRGFIDFLGGPIGHHAEVGRARWWTPLRVLILVALTWLSFGFLSKANCTVSKVNEDGSIGLDWSGGRQYISACYNDILPLYAGRGLDIGGFPYAFSWQEGDLTRYMEYPVLAGLFQGVLGWMARTTYPLIDATGLTLAESAWYFALTALVLSVLWVLSIRMLCDLAGNRIWDVWLVAASPLVIVHAFTNWDIGSIFFAVAAMWLVQRGRMDWAGIAIGLGTAFKMWPLFLLGAYFVLAWRNRRFGPWIVMALSAIASWVVVNVPIMFTYPQAWAEFFRLNRERGAEWTTIWAVSDRLIPPLAWQPELLNTLSLVLFAGSCLAIFMLGARVQRQPRVAELVFLIVAAFLLFNKVWSPQYSLWLVVPAVLALPQWKLLLSWMTVDMLVWPILMWHMHGVENKGLPHEMLDLVVLCRDGFIIAMVVLVVRQMLGKAQDKVAAAHAGIDILADPLAPSYQPGIKRYEKE